MASTYAYGGDPTGMSGLYHYGGGGRGVLGSLIPSSGDAGASYIYSSLSLPADAGKEYMGRLGTIPAGLTIDAGEDGAVTASANDGAYVVPWTLYENGAALGSTTFTLTFGVGTFLTGAPCVQANTCSTAAVSVTPAGGSVRNLVGAPSSQANTCSVAAVAIVGAPKTINLAGAPCSQANTCTARPITVGSLPPLDVIPEQRMWRVPAQTRIVGF